MTAPLWDEVPVILATHGNPITLPYELTTLLNSEFTPQIHIQLLYFPLRNSALESPPNHKGFWKRNKLQNIFLISDITTCLCRLFQVSVSIVFPILYDSVITFFWKCKLKYCMFHNIIIIAERYLHFCYSIYYRQKLPCTIWVWETETLPKWLVILTTWHVRVNLLMLIFMEWMH